MSGPAAVAGSAAAPGHTLAPGTRLRDYRVHSVLGEGGFGIVYLAQDRSLQRRVALKEYMPSSLAERTSGMQVSSLSEEDDETFRKGLESFINEARLLAQFDHPSLVKVHRFWEANGTAYMVMPFYEGPTLKEVLRDLPAPPDEAWLLGLLEPLTEVLAVIHGQQCYHRDIAPDNILLLAGTGRPLLLDFGAARRVIGDANQALSVILKPGYAPIEQYAEVPGMKQGPWTDVYALAAVLFFAITGKKPPAAVGRLLNDQYVPLQQQAAGRYSAGFLRAIDEALVVKPAERTQNIDAFRAAIGFGALAREPSGALSPGGGTGPGLPDPTLRGTAPPRPNPVPRPATAAPPPVAGGRGPAVWIGAGAAALVLAGAAWWLLGRPAPLPAAAPPLAAAPTPSPAAPPAPAAAPAAAAATEPATAPFSVVGELRRIVAAQTAGFSVEARTTRAGFRINKEVLRLSINSSRDGYFYVLTHTPDGLLFQYFPNREAPTHQILAGQSLTLPRDTRDPQTGALHAGIELTEPPGQAEALVIVSKYPRDFSALGKRYEQHFAVFPTDASAEALARQAGASGLIYAGRPVCPTGDACVDEFGAALVEFAVIR